MMSDMKITKAFLGRGHEVGPYTSIVGREVGWVYLRQVSLYGSRERLDQLGGVGRRETVSPVFRIVAVCLGVPERLDVGSETDVAVEVEGLMSASDIGIRIPI